MHRSALHIGGHMRVQIHRDSDGRVAQHGGDDLGRNGVAEHQGGIGMPQIMEAQIRQSGSLQGILKFMLQNIGGDRRTLLPAADQMDLIKPAADETGQLGLLFPFLLKCTFQYIREHQRAVSVFCLDPAQRKAGLIIGGGATNGNRTLCKVYVAPQEAQRLAATQTEGDRRRTGR